MRKWIMGLLLATIGLAAAAGTASAGDCLFDHHHHGYGRTYGSGYRGYPYGGYGGYGAGGYGGYGGGYGGVGYGAGYGSGYGYYAPAPTPYYPTAPYRSAYVSTPRLSIGFGY